MSLGFIPDDGYTERGYIAEVPRLYPALRFQFRPFLQEQRLKLLGENESLKPAAASRNTAKVLAAKIKQWDLKDAAGETVVPTADSLLRLKPALYARLLGVVMGLDPSDEDPQATEEEKEQSLADQLAAAEKGVPVGDARAERDAKN